MCGGCSGRATTPTTTASAAAAKASASSVANKKANIIMSLSEVSCQTEDDEEEAEDDLLEKLLDNTATVRDFSKHDAPPITNQLICSQLNKRWILDVPYTSFGPFVLSYVTPQRPLDEVIYSDAIREAYSSHYPPTTFNPTQPPHLYSLLNWQLWIGRVGLHRRQSLLLTGETGSGKSTNFRHALQYLAFLERKQTTTTRRRMRIANDVLEFDLVLDLFGSAATTHNPRGSTRYTKWVELGFDVTGNVVTASFSTYNLDKWKLLPPNSSSSLPSSNNHTSTTATTANNVVTTTTPPAADTQQSSSNFLIFYVILSAAEPTLLKSLGLVRNVDSYRILEHRLPPPPPLQQQQLSSSALMFTHHHPSSAAAGGGPAHPAASPHQELWRRVRRVLTAAIGGESTSNVFRILAALLKLGNISFVPTTKIDGSEGVTIIHFKNNTQSTTSISELLLGTGDDDDVVERLLSSTSSWTESNSLTATLMLTLYSRLFSWLTTKFTTHQQQHQQQQLVSFKLNLMDFTGGAVGGGGPSASSGSFESHLVETLNNEIQALVDAKLRDVQDTFSKDNNPWITIDTKHAGTPTNSTSSRRHHRHHHDDDNYPPQQHPQQNYSDHWLNTVGSLPVPLTSVLSSSSNSLVSHLFSLPSGGKPLTPLAQLSINASTLRLQLTRTHLCYVKCIRPTTTTSCDLQYSATNNTGSSSSCLLTSSGSSSFGSPPWEGSYVRYQLEMSHRLVDYTKVLRLSHVFALPVDRFLNRYKLLSLITWPHLDNQSSSVNNANRLLNDLAFNQQSDDYVTGTSHVFFKHINILLELESYREERLEDLALLIQKTYRGHAVRARYLRQVRAQKTIARAWRAALTRKHASTLRTRKRRRAAVNVIQRHYILWKRRMYLRMLSGVLCRRRGSMLSPVCKEWPVVPSYIQETNSLLKILFHRWRCRVYRFRVSSSSAEMARLNEKATASVIFRGNKASYPRSISHPFLGDYIRLRQNSQWRRTMSMTSLRDLASDSDNAVVFADLINKVTRSSGKFLPIVLAVTKTSLIILDPRSLTMKYRLSIDDLEGISMSRCLDDIVVIHVNPNANSAASAGGDRHEDNFFQHNCIISCSDHHHHKRRHQTNNGDNDEEEEDEEDEDDEEDDSGGGTLHNHTHSHHHHQHQAMASASISKGDVILHTCHAVEMVTKIFLVHKNLRLAKKNSSGGSGGGRQNQQQQQTATTSLLLPIHFSNEFDAMFGNQRVTLSFRYDDLMSVGYRDGGGEEEEGDNNIVDDENSIAGVVAAPPPPPPPPVIPPSCIKVKKKCARMEFVLRPSPSSC